jgi:hypothetical protein
MLGSKKFLGLVARGVVFDESHTPFFFAVVRLPPIIPQILRRHNRGNPCITRGLRHCAPGLSTSVERGAHCSIAENQLSFTILLLYLI